MTCRNRTEEVIGKKKEVRSVLGFLSNDQYINIKEGTQLNYEQKMRDIIMTQELLRVLFCNYPI